MVMSTTHEGSLVPAVVEKGETVASFLYRSMREFPSIPGTSLPFPGLSQESCTEITITIAKHTAQSIFPVGIVAQEKPERLFICSGVPWKASVYGCKLTSVPGPGRVHATSILCDILSSVSHCWIEHVIENHCLYFL